MKRANQITETTNRTVEVTDKRIWWRNGGGSFYAIIDGRNKIVKPNEKFQAFEYEIPKSFLNTIYPVDPLPSKEPVIVVQSVFEAIPSETDSALFDVINKETGKIVNGHPLEEKDAIDLAANLNNN